MAPEKYLLPLVDQVYAAGLEPERWNDFLRGLAAALRAPSAHLQGRVGDPEEVVGFAVGRDESYVQSYVNHYAARSPIARATRTQEPGSVHTSCELVPEEEFEKTDFYQEWERPQGMHHGLLGVVERDEAWGTALIGASRSKQAGDFGPAEIALLHSLLPHVRRAIELNRELSRKSQTGRAHGALVDALALGVIILEGEGRVQSMNPAARQILDRGDALFITEQGALRARGESRAQFDALVRHATLRKKLSACATSGAFGSGIGDRARALPSMGGRVDVRGRDGEALEISVAPLEERAETWGGSGGARALVLVSDGAGHAERTAQRLRGLYGLTRAESDVCALLLQGKDLREAAERRHIKVSTARSQLKQVLAKTGTRRQSELLRRLLTHPALALTESDPESGS